MKRVVVIGVVVRLGVIGSADRAAAGALPVGKPKIELKDYWRGRRGLAASLSLQNEA